MSIIQATEIHITQLEKSPARGTGWRVSPVSSQGQKSKGLGHKRVRLGTSLDTETRGMLQSMGTEGVQVS